MKCSYCTSDIKKGTGMMYVHNSGAVRYYCSSRCYKNDAVIGRRFNRKEAKAKKETAGNAPQVT